jgi:hypothetical protein
MKIKNELLEKRAHLVRLIHKIFGDVAARTFVATAVCLRLPKNPAYDTKQAALVDVSTLDGFLRTGMRRLPNLSGCCRRERGR